jgi:hypothetical protein
MKKAGDNLLMFNQYLKEESEARVMIRGKSFNILLNLFIFFIFILLINISFISASQKYTLKVTGEHPFYVIDDIINEETNIINVNDDIDEVMQVGSDEESKNLVENKNEDKTNGIWKTADELKVGNFLLTEDGKKAKVTSLKKINEDAEVYNLEVDGVNTYYANDVLVHNKPVPNVCEIPNSQTRTALRINTLKLEYDPVSGTTRYVDDFENPIRIIDVNKEGQSYIMIIKNALGEIVFEKEVIAITDNAGTVMAVHDGENGRRIIMRKETDDLTYINEKGFTEPLLDNKGKPVIIYNKNWKVKLASGLSEPCSECGCSSDGSGARETVNRKLAETVRNPNSAQPMAETAAAHLARDNEWIIHVVLKKYRTVWGQIEINQVLYDELVQTGKSELMIAVLEWKPSDGDLTNYLFRRVGKVIRDNTSMNELIRMASRRRYACQFPELEDGKFEDFIKAKPLTLEGRVEIESCNPLDRLKLENEALLEKTYGGTWITIDVYQPHRRAEYFVTVLQNEKGVKKYILFNKCADEKIVFDNQDLELLNIDQQNIIKRYVLGDTYEEIGDFLGINDVTAKTRFLSGLNALKNLENIAAQAKQFAKERLGGEFSVIGIRYDNCGCGKSDFLVILKTHEKIVNPFEKPPEIEYRRKGGSKIIRVTEFNINEIGLTEIEKFIIRQKLNEMKKTPIYEQVVVLITAQGKKIIVNNRLYTYLTSHEIDALLAYVNGVAFNDIKTYMFDIGRKGSRLNCFTMMRAVNTAIEKIIELSQNQ